MHKYRSRKSNLRTRSWRRLWCKCPNRYRSSAAYVAWAFQYSSWTRTGRAGPTCARAIRGWSTSSTSRSESLRPGLMWCWLHFQPRGLHMLLKHQSYNLLSASSYQQPSNRCWLYWWAGARCDFQPWTWGELWGRAQNAITRIWRHRACSQQEAMWSHWSFQQKSVCLFPRQTVHSRISLPSRHSIQ